MHQSKLVAFYMLLILLHGSEEKPSEQPKLSPFHDHHPPEYDNRYVWFTRDIHDDNRHEQDELLWKKFIETFHRLHSKRRNKRNSNVFY